ncbi:MAG: CotH kinase family protein [Muribaculaceae bacterium]|nr:CotH kinase family protein [Muribaculaceae bacterium]
MKNLKRYILAVLLLSGAATLGAQTDDPKLTGTPIGTSRGYQYENGGRVVNNIQHYAFDGDLNTYFATDARSYTWVGLDLGRPHVITRVGWSPRNDGVGPRRVRTGVIQGANSEDFLDALPIYVIGEDGVIGRMSYADVDCSRGFRYVRFVSTGDARCNIAELEFYGHEGEGDDSGLYRPTNLPTVVVNTVDAREPYDKTHDIAANILILNDDGINVAAPGTIRERGNGSRQFPKKPWRLKFDQKQTVLDAPAKAKKWTLINNYGDKTLMRNMLAFEMARCLDMRYVSYCQPVDVILNGEYKGCYQLCDQQEVKAGRLDITEMDSTDISGVELTGGYFLEIDAYANEEPAGSWFTSQNRIPVTIKSPDNGGTPEQFNYIRSYFNKLESLVYSSDFTNPLTGYRSILDVESFLQHFIVGELTGNTDTYWSTFMYKERNDPTIYTGPVWDFDLGFDNDYRTYPVNQYSTYLFNQSSASAADNMKNFVRRIIYGDPQIASDISRLWSLARNDRNLTADALTGYADSLALVLDQSQQLNFKRWPILSQQVHMNPRALGSYAAEVNAVKNFIRQRFSKLDVLMHYDPNLSALCEVEESMPAVSVSDGMITVGGGVRFTVAGIDGTIRFSGCGTTPRLPRGLYILTAGSLTRKINSR